MNLTDPGLNLSCYLMVSVIAFIVSCILAILGEPSWACLALLFSMWAEYRADWWVAKLGYHPLQQAGERK